MGRRYEVNRKKWDSERVVVSACETTGKLKMPDKEKKAKTINVTEIDIFFSIKLPPYIMVAGCYW